MRSIAAWSPAPGRGIGFARLDQAGLEPGAAAAVPGLDGVTHPASLCSPPMVDPERRIPRGLNREIPKKP